MILNVIVGALGGCAVVLLGRIWVTLRDILTAVEYIMRRRRLSAILRAEMRLRDRAKATATHQQAASVRA